jgi:hypothetical protein
MLKVSKILKAATVYGWLFPDGSYHAVPYCCHAKWASEYLNIEYGGYGFAENYGFAYKHNWIRVVSDGASAGKWNTEKLHRLQVFLMEKGFTANTDKCYYLDSDDDIDLRTTYHELLTANKLRDLLPISSARAASIQ